MTLAQALPVECSIRRARVDDAPAIADLVNRAYRVEDFFVSGDRTSAREIRELMSGGDFLVLRRSEGGLAAAVYVEPRERRGYFGLLAVAPDVQGTGLGRRLVGVAEAYCRALRCDVMEIQVVNVRRELPPWYQRLGYRAVGTKPFPPVSELKQPCHYIKMSKPLNDVPLAG